MDCVVIIPAAGSGTRFGGSIPKQYVMLRGRPLISYAIEKFLREKSVQRIVICVSQDYRTEFERMVVASGWRSVDVARIPSLGAGEAFSELRSPGVWKNWVFGKCR